MPAGIKANSDGSAAIQVGGTDVITLTSGGAATFVTSPTTVQAGTAAAPSITFSGDTNTGIYSPGADTIAFTEGGVEALRINSSGTVVLSGGSTSANGTGITFPATQSASSNANTLDDYEEGTFTPTLTFNGASVGVTYNATFNGATYTKIGNRVFVSGLLVVTNKGSSTGDASIGNLPFTSEGGQTKYHGAYIAGYGFTFADFQFGRIAPNQTSINLFEVTNAGVSSALTNADFSNNSDLYFSAHYTV